jgi:Bacterial alpha-L-rhamnosidase 6 hairpin glycosidase domain/Bacterial alpha-L-rhamnosidase C-terminal domain
LPTSYNWTDDYGCRNGSKVCSDGLHGFRYVKIYLDALSVDSPYTSATGWVSISDVFLNFTSFLGTPDTFTGWFECSDKSLNKYWYEAAYTNDLCIDTFHFTDTDPRDSQSPTLLEKLVLYDGAKRDRDPYVGDLGVAGRTVYLTHDVSISVKNILVDLAAHQRDDGWIPPASIFDYSLTLFDYPLWWVVSSHDLLLYTGDISYVQKVYPNLTAVLDDWYSSVTDTLTDLLFKGLAGTRWYGDYAFLGRSGAVAYYNALYVMALNSAAGMANASNRASDASRWTARARRVARAMNNVLWDPSVGAYRDTPGSTRHGQDGNSIAILAGVANSTQASSILKYWSTLAQPYGNPFFDNDSLGPDFSKRVYAFISYFEIAARFANNMGDSAIEEIKRLYGWMSTHDPKTTYWEGIGTGGSMYEGGFTSAAHGWSTGVLPALTNYLLGVIPTQQGFSRFSVKPMPSGGVTWASGQVPTPHGPIIVNWTTQAAPLTFQLLVTVPAGCQADIAIPVTSAVDSVAVDGHTIWNGAAASARLYSASYAAGYVALQQLPAGSYTIEVLEGTITSESNDRTSAAAQAPLNTAHGDVASCLRLLVHSVLMRVFWWRSEFSTVAGLFSHEGVGEVLEACSLRYMGLWVGMGE